MHYLDKIEINSLSNSKDNIKVIVINCSIWFHALKIFSNSTRSRKIDNWKPINIDMSI